MAAAVRSRGAPWAHWARAASSGAPPLRVLKANRDWAQGGVRLKLFEGRHELVIIGRHSAAGSSHCLRKESDT